MVLPLPFNRRLTIRASKTPKLSIVNSFPVSHIQISNTCHRGLSAGPRQASLTDARYVAGCQADLGGIVGRRSRAACYSIFRDSFRGDHFTCAPRTDHTIRRVVNPGRNRSRPVIELRIERRPILRFIVITALAATATIAVFLPLLFLCR